MRVQAIITYDGSKFKGIQSQPHKNTVQDKIEFALLKLNINSKINYGGRTDAGVHALNQSVDFLIPPFWNNLENLKRALNKIIAPYIFIKKIRMIHKNFHSRFLATSRSYRYLITNRKTPFLSDYTFYKKDLDIKIMQQAIKFFIGKHDFEYFHKVGSEPHSFIREIYNTYIINYKNFVIIKFTGNGFLRSQVRMMIQFLIDISDEKLTIKNLQNQLEKKEKFSTNLIIPNGLYFERVFYKRSENEKNECIGNFLSEKLL